MEACDSWWRRAAEERRKIHSHRRRAHNRPLAEARKQQLRLACPEELRVELPPGFESVVGNLLTNAIRYTPPGGTLDVRLEGNAAHASLEVEDTGPGIEPALRPRLFKKFERLEHEASVGSHGLGLSIAYSVVELAGGTIEALGRSDGASGALFRVRVPRRAGRG